MLLEAQAPDVRKMVEHVSKRLALKFRLPKHISYFFDYLFVCPFARKSVADNTK